MSWSNLTPEQRGLLRWLGKYESEVKNKEYEVAWRPGDRIPVIANGMTPRSRQAPGSLTRLNIEEMERQRFLTCSWGRDSVKFILTAAAYGALTPKVFEGSASIDPAPAATLNHAKVVQLSKIINGVYDDEEFRHLCFEINVKYDDLRGETLRGKVEALVLVLDRAGRLDELWEKIRQDRPHAFRANPDDKLADN